MRLLGAENEADATIGKSTEPWDSKPNVVSNVEHP